MTRRCLQRPRLTIRHEISEHPRFRRAHLMRIMPSREIILAWLWATILSTTALPAAQARALPNSPSHRWMHLDGPVIFLNIYIWEMNAVGPRPDISSSFCRIPIFIRQSGSGSPTSEVGRCCRKKPRHSWLCYWGGDFGLFLVGRCLIGEHQNRPAKPLTQSTHTLHLLAGRVDAAPSS
jgi:hypothetical protein